MEMIFYAKFVALHEIYNFLILIIFIKAIKILEKYINFQQHVKRVQIIAFLYKVAWRYNL